MSIVDRFLPKEKEPEYFLLLKIGLSTISAVIWEVKDEKVIIIDSSTASLEKDYLIEDADRAITEVEKHLPEGKLVEKVIFGLTFYYVQNDAIKPELLSKLKDLTKTLGLTPLGFIEIPQALSSYLRKKEDAPVSALLVEIDEKSVSVSFLRVGKIFDVKRSERSTHVVADIEKAIKGFTNADILPARILLYDGGGSLDSIKEELLKYPWHTKSSFLHIPKIEILKDEEIIKALISAASTEITKHFIQEETSPTIHHKEVITLPSEEKPVTDNAESMGFVMDVDVAEDTTTEEQFPPRESHQIEEHVAEDINSLPQGEKRTFSFPIIPKLPNFGLFGRVKWILIVVVILIATVISGVYAYWQLPKASVKLIVGAQTMSKDIDITIDPRVATVDTEKLVVPGRTIDIPVSSEKTIKTTGEKNIGSPAKGKVTVFNKTTSEKSFAKGTILAQNLRYTLDGDIKIASASDTGEGLTFGKIETNITASAIGPAGNLPDGTQFSLADFPTTEYSARAEGNLSGGTSRQIDAVAKIDQDTVFSDLSKELNEKSQSNLQEQLKTGEQILDNSLTLDISKKEFDKDVGDEGSDLTLRLTGKLTGIGYSKEDLNSLSQAFLSGNIPSGYSFSKDRTRLQAKRIDIQDDGSAKVSAYLRASLLPEISVEDISRELAGKSVKEASDYLKGRDHIMGVEIGIDTPFPFGKESLPRNISNITLSIASQ